MDLDYRYAANTCSIKKLIPNFYQKLQVDPDKWHIVFYITSFIYFASNLFFIIFGRGKVQSWNNPNRKVSIVSVYDPKIIGVDV